MTFAADIAKINADGTTFHDIVHGASGQTVPTDGGECPTLAEALARAAGGNIRGAWVTGTAYIINDVVTNGGVGYRCIIAHTASASFATDAANWIVQTAIIEVGNSQLANVATATIKGRATAGTGRPEDLTAAQAASVIGPSLSGLTNAQLASVATAIIKGRSTAGTGAVEDLTAAQVQALMAALDLTWTGKQTFTGDIGGAGARIGLRNSIVNGCMRKWDYGTTQTTSGYGCANNVESTHSGTTKTASRQSFTPGQTDVPGEPAYFLRHVVTSSAGSGNFSKIRIPIESVKSHAGRTVTVSFYAKADASRPIAIEFGQNFGAGGSPSSAVTGIGAQQKSLTSSWAKYTATISIPSISGKTLGTTRDGSLDLYVWFDAGSSFNTRTASLGQQSGTFEIARIRVVAGTMDGDADPDVPIEILEMQCARFLPKLSAATGGSGAPLARGFAHSPSGAYGLIQFPTRARCSPTGIGVSSTGHFSAMHQSEATVAFTGQAFYSASDTCAEVKFSGASGLTTGDAIRVYFNNAAGAIYFTGCEP